jgi:hypothetical protein
MTADLAMVVPNLTSQSEWKIMKDTQRVLARKLARELTAEEIETVAGGGNLTTMATNPHGTPDVVVDYEY